MAVPELTRSDPAGATIGFAPGASADRPGIEIAVAPVRLCLDPVRPLTGPGLPHPGSLSSADGASAQNRVSITLITAGPIRTMNSTGRMNTIMGTVRVAGRRAAFSSALSIR